MRQTAARARLLLALGALVVTMGACGGSSGGGGDAGDGSAQAGPDGYAAQAKTDVDRLAQLVLPALVQDLGVQVYPGRAAFTECQLTGWSYRAELDLIGAADDETVSAAMQEQGLELVPRDDGRLLGRQDSLSMLVDRPVNDLRHVTLSDACTPYSEADVAYAQATDSTDYASFVPPGAIFTPAG